MRFAVIPISTRAVYIHCIRHDLPTAISSANHGILDATARNSNNKSSSVTIPATKTPRFDDKIVARAGKVWTSFEQSDTPWKKKLVGWINVLLEQIPYPESELRSIPAKKSVLRQVAESEEARSVEKERIQEGLDQIKTVLKNKLKIDKNHKSHISYEDFELLKNSSFSSSSKENSNKIQPLSEKEEQQQQQSSSSSLSNTQTSTITPINNNNTSSTSTAIHEIVEPISVYFPSNIITADECFNAMRSLATHGRVTHFRNMIICLGVAPFTLPVAMIPVIPNVPGIYLMYRAWCNLKALEGARHLAYLTEEDGGVGEEGNLIEEKDRIKNQSSQFLIRGHLRFKPSEELNSIYKTLLPLEEQLELKYKAPSESNNKNNNNNNEKQVIILNESVVKNIEELVEGIDSASSLHYELTKAIHQTNNKIKKEQKENQQKK